MNSHTHHPQPRRDRHVTLGEVRPTSRGDNHRSRTTPDFRFVRPAPPPQNDHALAFIIGVLSIVGFVSYALTGVLVRWIAA